MVEQINHWNRTNQFLQKILIGAIFLLAPSADMLGTS